MDNFHPRIVKVGNFAFPVTLEPESLEGIIRELEEDPSLKAELHQITQLDPNGNEILDHHLFRYYRDPVIPPPEHDVPMVQPTQPKPVVRSLPVSDQSLVSWIPCTNGQIPEQAIVGGGIPMGLNGALENIYIIRAWHNRRLVGGRLIISEGVAYIYGKRGIPSRLDFHPFRKWYYEALVLNNLLATVTWEDSPGPNHIIPPNALTFQNSGQRDANPEEPAYIARLKIKRSEFTDANGYFRNRRSQRRRHQRQKVQSEELEGAEGTENAHQEFLYLPGYYLSSIGSVVACHPEFPRNETLVRNTGIQFLVVSLNNVNVEEEKKETNNNNGRWPWRSYCIIM